MAKDKTKSGKPSFVLTKANLNDITRAFKPLIKEDTVRLDIDPTGNLVFSVNLYRDWETDRKSTRLNSSHSAKSRMPSSA